MQLSAKGRYAVMSMVYLADRFKDQDSQAPCSLAQISEDQQISLPFLEQIFMDLRRGDIVEGIRGPGGGYRFARPLNKITLAEILNAVDEAYEMTRCISEDEGCVKGERCLTHNLWRGLSDHIQYFFKTVTLKDIIDNQLSMIPFDQALKVTQPPNIEPKQGREH